MEQVNEYESLPDGALIALQPEGDKRPLFLVSRACAREQDFLLYVGNLLPHLRDRPVYGFKARGLDGVTEPHHSTEEMARDYIREMRAVQPEGPYLLCGECVGGIVAYEMAQQLHAAGQPVALVAMMDTDLPSDEVWTGIQAMQRRRKGQRLEGHREQLARLPLSGKLGYASRLLRKKLRAVLPMTSSARRAKQTSLVEQLFIETNFAYRPKPYPGKLTLIVSQELLRRGCHEPWKRLGGEVETHAVPGDHVSRITTHAEDSARVLRTCLDQAAGAV